MSSTIERGRGMARRVAPPGGRARAAVARGLRPLVAALRVAAGTDRLRTIEKRGRTAERETRLAGKRVERVQGEVRSIDRRLGKLYDARVSVGRLDYPHEDIYLRLGSLREVRRLKSCGKEPWTVRWIEERVGRDAVLYDIGANVGAYALVAGRRAAGRGGRVIALEPGYATFASLCENVLLNDLADVVMPLPVALDAETHLTSFDYRDLEAGESFHGMGDSDSAFGAFEPAYRQPILAQSLDDLIARYGLPAPDHLKIDVDGPELQVLEGARATLAGGSLKSLMIELSEEREAGVKGLLEGAGYRVEGSFDRAAGQRAFYALFVPA